MGGFLSALGIGGEVAGAASAAAPAATAAADAALSGAANSALASGAGLGGSSAIPSFGAEAEGSYGGGMLTAPDEGYFGGVTPGVGSGTDWNMATTPEEVAAVQEASFQPGFDYGKLMSDIKKYKPQGGQQPQVGMPSSINPPNVPGVVAPQPRATPIAWPSIQTFTSNKLNQGR